MFSIQCIAVWCLLSFLGHLLAMTSETCPQGNCSTITKDHKSSKSGHRLPGHVFKTMQSEDQFGCLAHCALHCACVSTNFKISSKQCELNSEKAETQSDNLVVDLDYNYAESIIQPNNEVRFVLR